MRKVRFKAVGRKASLVGDKYSKKMKEFFSYSQPGAKFSPTFRAGVWDGRICMMRNGVVPVGLLRGTRESLLKEGWKVKISHWKDRPNLKEKKGIVAKEKQYNYQNECVRAMLDSVKWGGGLVLSATGSGKTAMASMFASWLVCPILFVVDQLDLLYQSQKEMEMWLSKYAKKKIKVGVVGNSKYEPERVTAATIQTLHAHRNDPKFLMWFKTVQVVIIDEVHVQMSRRNFNVLDIIKPQAVFGLTATLQLRKKAVRMKAYSICGPTVYEFPIKEAAEQGVVSKGCALQVRVNCEEVLEKPRPYWHYDAKDVQQRNINYKWDVVKNKPVNKAIISIVKEAIKRGYYVATLVERIRHLGILKKDMEKLKLMPQVVAGPVSTDSRERRKQRFEKGESRCLLSTRVFAKGVNIKRLDLVIDAAQQSNKDGTLQKYGRTSRLHPDKEGILYFDMVAATDRKPTRKGEKRPSTEKSAASRFSALKRAGIPVEKIKYDNARKTLDKAEKMLSTVLKGAKK